MFISIANPKALAIRARNFQPATALSSEVQQPQVSEHFMHSSKFGDVAEAGKLLVTKLGPAAAITAGLATVAYQNSGLMLAGAALVGVPLAAAGAVKFAESLSIGGGPNYGGAKGLNSILIGGAGLIGGAVGTAVGVHYGSAAAGALAGALAPAGVTAAVLGGFALFN